jgi:hypothetical protein
MRFLFGILTGAALTLLVATATDAPTSPVIEQLRGIWQQLISSTGEQLFRHSTASDVTTSQLENLARSRIEQSPPAEPSPEREQRARSETDQAAVPAQPSAANSNAASEHADAILMAPQPTSMSPPAIESQLTQTTSSPVSSPTRGESLPASEQLAGVESLPASEQLAAVWAPFHSERSATGFARGLSRHFEYPFSVRRSGPGAYQVIFPYDSPDQRENMLMEIAELTGQ